MGLLSVLTLLLAFLRKSWKACFLTYFGCVFPVSKAEIILEKNCFKKIKLNYRCERKSANFAIRFEFRYRDYQPQVSVPKDHFHNICF